jgi:hypothetical protein
LNNSGYAHRHDSKLDIVYPLPKDNTEPISSIAGQKKLPPQVSIHDGLVNTFFDAELRNLPEVAKQGI